MKFGKVYKEIASQVLGCNLSSFYAWDKQERPIVKLLQTYFPNKEDLQEFLDTGKILRLELCKEDEEENIYANIQYLHVFLDQDKSVRFIKSSDYGYDFYFLTLLKIKKIIGDKPDPFMNFHEYAWISLYQSVSDPDSFRKNEVIPIFSEFGCEENKAFKMNIYHAFDPVVRMARENCFDEEEKKEAYTHGLLFNLYSIHSEKTLAEKKHLLKTLFSSLFPEEVKEVPSGPFLNPFIELNIDLIENNYDLIIKSLVEKQ